MSQIESFQTLPLQAVIPSYLYAEYSGDDDLQAFINSQNSLAQGYLDWFNNTPLGVYTASSINGPLLDWIANGIYGIPRPVLSTQSSLRIAGYNSAPYNTVNYNSLQYYVSGSASPASNDIYKRVMTWNLYKGDGQVFCMQWLKNRIARFVNGANGSDYPVLNAQPSITISGTTFTVSASNGQIWTYLSQCIANRSLNLPFQYTFVIGIYLVNNGGVLQVLAGAGYPSSPTSLADGAIWNDGGVVAVVPGVTPNPATPPVYFSNITAAALLTLGGGNLPLSNPGIGTGQLWNNGGVVCIS
jgi:hypothetical protein